MLLKLLEEKRNKPNLKAMEGENSKIQGRI
jgi:hypothetical protein